MDEDVTIPPRSKWPLWLFGFILVGAGAATVFVVRAYQAPINVAPPPRVAVTASLDAGSAPVAMDLKQGDAFAEAGLKGLGSAPELASWASQPDLVRRIASAVNLVADGESPRPVLGFLEPSQPFGVELHHGQTFISTASEARYDRFAQVFGTIDAGAAGRLYGSLSAYLDSAFGEVARPGKHFEEGFRAAVDRLASVPFDGPLEVVPMEKGVGFAFKDPRLEALSPAEKHLLRLGPENARIVVSKLKEFEAAAFPGT